MTDIVGKKCSNPNCEHKGERQPLENFHADKRAKDGLQRYCKSCNIAKQSAHRKGLLTPQKVTKVMKLAKINENLKQLPTVTEAYKALGTTTSNASAAVQANKFFNSLGEDLVDKFLAEWKTEGSMSAFEEYFEEARKYGTLTEKRDACVLKAKMLGLMKDKVETTTNGITPEARDAKLSKVIALLQTGKSNKEGGENE